MKTTLTDRFLSEEDLDLQTLDDDELIAWWNLWLEQAQVTNEADRDEYAHGVFRHGPSGGALRRRAPDACAGCPASELAARKTERPAAAVRPAGAGGTLARRLGIAVK